MASCSVCSFISGHRIFFSLCHRYLSLVERMVECNSWTLSSSQVVRFSLNLWRSRCRPFIRVDSTNKVEWERETHFKAFLFLSVICTRRIVKIFRFSLKTSFKNWKTKNNFFDRVEKVQLQLFETYFEMIPWGLVCNAQQNNAKQTSKTSAVCDSNSVLSVYFIIICRAARKIRMHVCFVCNENIFLFLFWEKVENHGIFWFHFARWIEHSSAHSSLSFQFTDFPVHSDEVNKMKNHSYRLDSTALCRLCVCQWHLLLRNWTEVQPVGKCQVFDSPI